VADTTELACEGLLSTSRGIVLSATAG